MLFPYFVYVAHFKKFTCESFLFKEKSLLVENHMRKKVVGEKELAAKPKFAIHNVKTRFPFIYASTSLDTKRLTLASNCNFESCMSIQCFAPRHILQFFHFCCGVFLCFWQLCSSLCRPP